MDAPGSPWIDAILVVLLAVGNLLAVPLWFHLLTGPRAGLRKLVAGLWRWVSSLLRRRRLAGKWGGWR